MATTPTERDQHSELREALEHAVRLLRFCAGREAVSDPAQSARLSTAADDMTDLLNRTAP